MKLPIYEIGIDGLDNLNPEGPVLERVGTGVTETDPDDILNDYKSFNLTGGVGYKTESPMREDWTLEVIPSKTPLGGLVIASDEYRNGAYSYGVYLFPSYIQVQYFNGRVVTTGYKINVPAKKYVPKPTYRIINQDNVLHFYYNDEPISTFTLNASYLNGNAVLLGRLQGDLAYESPTGNYDRVLFNPGFTLEPTMFRIPHSRPTRDEELSEFTTDPILKISDISDKVVDVISTYRNYILVKYSDGSIESFSRPQGVDEGNWITDIYFNTDDDVILVMNDGTEENLGPRPPDISNLEGEAIEGSGYKVGNKALPLAIQGNAFRLVNGKIAAGSTTSQTLDYSSRVSLQLDISGSLAGSLLNGNYAWTQLPVVASMGASAIADMVGKKAVFKPGVYWVEGYVHAYTGIRSGIRFEDSEGNVIKELPAIDTGVTSNAESRNIKVGTLVYLYRESSIEVSLRGPAVIAAVRNYKVVNLNVYKVR